MVNKNLKCEKCGNTIKEYKNPIPTVDIIIEVFDSDVFKGIILIERLNIPYGWAIPGGFVDYGESLEHAAVREAKEETGVNIKDLTLLGVYSNPERDARHHTVSTVYTAKTFEKPVAGDDAKNLKVFNLSDIPEKLAFDHNKIIQDYMASL